MILYLTDGTEDSFYTAVFIAYRDRSALVSSEPSIQIPLDGVVVNVLSDRERAKRVKDKISSIDEYALDEIGLVLRNDHGEKEQTCLEYIRLLIANRKPIRGFFSDPIVLKTDTLRQQVTNEIHRLSGFVRFIETENGVLYAPIAPDNDIVDCLVRHFAARMGKQPFIIHDTVRGKAVVYNGSRWIVQPIDRATIVYSDDEEDFQALWKLYYRSVNIEERKHIKQMVNYMPVRYWKFMPEMK